MAFGDPQLALANMDVTVRYAGVYAECPAKQTEFTRGREEGNTKTRQGSMCASMLDRVYVGREVNHSFAWVPTPKTVEVVWYACLLYTFVNLRIEL
jgi:hypothetical protein